MKPAGMLRFFSVGVVDQAVLSATNFVVGLLMLRRTDDADYGLFVLATTTFLLLVGAQNAVVTGPMSVLGAKHDDARRLAMVSTLLRLCFGFWLPLASLGALAFHFAPAAGIPPSAAMVGLAGSIAAVGVLLREVVRNLWMLYSLPRPLLGFELLYAGAYLLCAAIVTAHARPAAPVLVLALGGVSSLAALASWLHFRRKVGWSRQPLPGAFAQVWRLGRWALLGSAVTWLQTQGFYYLVTAMRGVEAVAGLAAARLLLMPVNLMITGVGQLLLPMGTRWLVVAGHRTLLRNLLLLAMTILASAAIYFLLLWLMREFVVVEILKRDPRQLETPMLLWGAVFALVALRSMAQIAPQAMERFDALARLAVLAAALSLLGGWLGIRAFGANGALLGLILGESVDLVGIVYLVRRELRTRAGRAADG